MVTKLDINAVDLWVADTNARVIGRQSTQDDSFAVQVQPGSSYLLFAFDEDNNTDEWTVDTLNQKLYEYFNQQNAQTSADYNINNYQLIGLANTGRVVNFRGGSFTDPDFYATLAGSFKLSFDLLPNVTLPSLPQNVLDLFESNQIQAKVSRHFQQPYKNYTADLVGGTYTTKYMALVVVNAVDGDEDIVIDDPKATNKKYALTDYFIAIDDVDGEVNTDPLFTTVQNLGYLLEDKKALQELAHYYKITLFGSNQMRMAVGE